MMRNGILFFLILIAYSVNSSAGERYEFFTGVRQNGMGGASIAVVNDETALLSNPAGLGKLRDYIVTIADPELSFGQETTSFLGKNTNFSEYTNPQGILNILNNENKDRYYHFKAQMFPSVVVPNFGIGVFAKHEYNAEVKSETDTYHLNYINDYALVLGQNLRFFDGRIKIGASGRYLNRVEYHGELPANSENLEWRDLVNEGTAIAADGGIIMTAPWKLLPTIAATWRDIGGTSFNMGDGFIHKTGRKPAYIPSSLDVAIALFPIHTNNLRSSFTVEYRDILTSSEEKDHMSRFHGGIEFNFEDRIFFRAGMNQRYWTAGFEFALRYIQIQAATYGEEIGTDTNYKEDRRVTGKISIRF